MMNLERLRVLHAVWTTGSVAGAARALHVTTSAISQQMARLEREVGQRLLERQGRGIKLTDAGALLARNAGELLIHVERVEAGLAEHRGAVAGSLTIAAFATAARGLLPTVLRDLRLKYPELSVSLSEQEPRDAIPALARGHIDLAIVQDWADDVLAVPQGMARMHLLDDPFDVALPIEHPLADRDTITIGELAGDEWISWNTGQLCHDWLVSSLRANGFEPRVAHTASEHPTQLALVAAGLGNAVVPRLGREPVSASVRFVSLDPQPVRRVFVLWRESTTVRPAIRAALDALQAGRPEAPRALP
jgi:DNA-binding transcriptional LysR family regulator